ncbi:hypothetical protein JAAARDRAFT_34268 [Jaapia argillacea MUCL 33604]|uniref:Uncharacterized protein n=1 Tax=Jaapia argillacea MUCL 33604 TaxID=933084 RepID=A0A067PX78_9AGAM|nr:hypothetical protein JAAARDRAFT_34268 [Jaapia argillacea MUCL 33604]
MNAPTQNPNGVFLGNSSTIIFAFLIAFLALFGAFMVIGSLFHYVRLGRQGWPADFDHPYERDGWRDEPRLYEVWVKEYSGSAVDWERLNPISARMLDTEGQPSVHSPAGSSTHQPPLSRAFWRSRDSDARRHEVEVGKSREQEPYTPLHTAEVIMLLALPSHQHPRNVIPYDDTATCPDAGAIERGAAFATEFVLGRTYVPYQDSNTSLHL